KVKPDEFTFDFSHDARMTRDEMDEVERLVNEKIYADLPVTAIPLHLADAKKIPGVRAMFGEKYPDPVRVLLIGAEKPGEATLEHSVEFCGGTHLSRTGQAGYFMIHREDGVAKGVRRLTCKTAGKAVQQRQEETGHLMDMAEQLNCRWEDLRNRVEEMLKENKKLRAQQKKG